MLLGTYNPKVDEKGRLALPAKHRRIFEDQAHSHLMIMKGNDNSLFIYAPQEYSSLIDRIKNKDIPDAQKNDAIRNLGSSTFDDTIDKQGRVTLPPLLRTQANISPNENVVLVGALSHLEVWSQSAWDERNKRAQAALEKTLDEVMLF